jgi:hypothetical protein
MTQPEQPEPDSLRIELQEALATFRHQSSLQIQTVGFLISADSILVAYGFSQRLSSVLLIASLMPVSVLLAIIYTARNLTPVAYVAIKLERQLSITQTPLIATWVRMRDDSPISSVEDISKLDATTIRSLVFGFPWYLLKSLKVRLVLATFIGQLFLFLISIAVFHYRFM